VDVARHIATTERDEPLSALQAAQLLGHAAPAPGGLTPYLLHRQREFIEDTARRTSAEPTAVLQGLKLDSARLPKSGNLDDLGLLYPELMPK
jgi:hypothetical protein